MLKSDFCDFETNFLDCWISKDGLHMLTSPVGCFWQRIVAGAHYSSCSLVGDRKDGHMRSQELIDQGKSVSVRFPDGNDYDGWVSRDSDGKYELTVDDLPESLVADCDRLEATAMRSAGTYLFLDARLRAKSSRGWGTADTTGAVFSPATTFFSAYPDNPLSGDITVLGARVNDLDLWLNKSSFRFARPSSLPETTLTYSVREEVAKYKFQDYMLSFYLDLETTSSSRRRELNLKQAAHIELGVTEGASDVPYQKLVEALRSVERLLGLAFRFSIRTVVVDIISKDFDLGIGGKAPSVFPPFNITLSDVRPSAPQVSSSNQLAFTFDQIDDFQAILNRWSKLENQLTPIVDLFLTSVSGSSSVLQNIFLNRIQGIEGFHRTLRRRSLRGTGGNSLVDRLRYLDTELKAKGISIITICGLDVVANTRDYYSHYEETITDICPIDQLPELTHQTGQMLFALILTELGIDIAVVLKAVRRTGVINPF
jgi:hypothetical protein